MGGGCSGEGSGSSHLPRESHPRKVSASARGQSLSVVRSVKRLWKPVEDIIIAHQKISKG